MSHEKENKKVLALYDFRNKQKFIYRTNRMKEITGGSELMATLPDLFFDEAKKRDINIDTVWKNGNKSIDWDDNFQDVFDAAVAYKGGGNLCIAYKDEGTCIKANRIFSSLVIEKAYSLQLMTAYVKCSENFNEDVLRVGKKLNIVKRVGTNSIPCNVLPFTQVDRKTYQPIVKKDIVKEKDREEIIESSQESMLKEKAYKALDDNKKFEGKHIDDLIEKKGEDSLIAVLYFDGNSIGQKLKSSAENANSESYKDQIEAVRQFSIDVHRILVEDTLKEIKNQLSETYPVVKKEKEDINANKRSFRTIVDHGDEITIVANAHAVPTIVNAYFDSLSKHNNKPENENNKYYACCGIAICHSHDPFSEVYKIAEECCENAKKTNRAAILEHHGENSFVDFHFCHSGITGSLKEIRKSQEDNKSLRPYCYASKGSSVDFKDFLKWGNELKNEENVSRGDIKILGAYLSQAWFDVSKNDLVNTSRFDLQMAKIESKTNLINHIRNQFNWIEEDKMLRKFLFDISEFFDLWF